MTEFSTKRQSLQTCVSSYSPVPLDSIEDLLTWLAGDSHANHLALQGNEKQAMTPEICGQQRWKLLGQSSHPLCTLRTYQDCLAPQWTTEQGDLFTILERYSETWPKAGTMSNGVCWGLTMSELHTIEKDFGFSEHMPTPNTMDHLPPRSQEANEKRFAEGGSRANRSAPDNLREWVHPEMWPTPKATGQENAETVIARKGREAAKMHNLTAADQMYPTIRASEYKDSGPVGSKSHKHMKDRDYLCAVVKDVEQPAGKLNPDWTEWLMGWPIGATDLKPLEMGKFHSQWLVPMKSYLRSLLNDF